MEVSPRYALVLAAGFGRRMGPLGQKLAKPLWPIFGNTILGHLLDQLLEKGFEEIYVNAHHLSDQVSNYILQNYPSVVILKEDPILDSGGAIVNCAKAIANQKGELYTFNGDNIIDLSGLSFSPPSSDITLFSEVISKESNYNRLIIDEGRLKKIVQGDQQARTVSDLTYAGISIFKLQCPLLRAAVSPIGIFQDLLDFQRDNVQVRAFTGSQVDLGTREKYVSGLLFLLEQASAKGSNWECFLHKYCKLQTELVNMDNSSYAAPNARDTLNFGLSEYSGSVSGAILFDDQWQQVMTNSLHFSGKTYPYGL